VGLRSRVTKRPLNRCEACGYTWYPRGKTLSPRCPRRGSDHTAVDNNGAPVSLAVLADALEEAGGAGEVMEHLRNPGPDVRGCHVLDAILG
jgi:hypothetical protein